MNQDPQPPAGASTPIDDSDHQNQDSDFPQEGSASHPLQLGSQPRQEVEYEENFKQEKVSHDHKRLTVKGEDVTDEALGLPGDPTGPEHELLSDDQGELGSLEAELKDKEVKWQSMWESDQALVEKKGEEMSMLLSGIETTEEKKHFMLKKVADIEATMRELQGKKDELEAGVKNKDEKLNKMFEKKKRLETFTEGKVSESKAAMRMLEKEMEEIKAKIETLKKVERLQPENLKLLEYIDKQIEAKEKKMECPACLEVAKAPIFRCDELHIICFDCRPKVKRDKLITQS